MLLEVAMALGPSFQTVAEQPWRLTLYLYYRLVDRERIRTLRDRLGDVDRANLTAVAFNEPKQLTAERQDVLNTMRHRPGDIRAAARREAADLLARGQRLAAQLERDRVFVEGEPASRIIVEGAS